MSRRNDWNVKYSSILFFCRVLKSHNNVSSFCRSRDILFHITRHDFTEIKVLLVDEYVLAIAALHRTVDEFPSLEHIVTAGRWNGYTTEAKKYGLRNNIGIFVIDEFLGALNWSEPIKYVKRDDDGQPVYRYKIA